MEIKAIVFDLGNVVLTNDHCYHTLEELKEFSDHLNITLDNMETAFNFPWKDYSTGKISEEEFWKRYLFTARANSIDIDYAKNFYRRNQKENENMLSLLRKLAKNYILAALTTIPKEWLKFKKEKFNLDKYFKTIVASGEVGLRKPDPLVYKMILDKLKIPANHILFIDDREDLLLPAKDLGIKTILFRGQKDLEEKLKELEISF
ncbi:MAG: hypothetical protein A2W22_04295 [Candidatus Levybacteria bacterium RBG_16_35_11]|nr:MAG: hypothetical protein A2W22_04295 [Candidatus Levybacteria bacterium RBG_16_35_11]